MCCGFFFSSRRRHTRYWRDWSSDVCSSDLVDQATGEIEQLYSTDNLPDGVLHTRCNNRRASRCEPCSRLYQGDEIGRASCRGKSVDLGGRRIIKKKTTITQLVHSQIRQLID